MTARFLIRCSKKSGRQIVALGGIDPHNKPWSLTEAEVIKGITDGLWSFYIKSGTSDTGIEIATLKDGRSYVKATSDASMPSSLLALPDCP